MTKKEIDKKIEEIAVDDKSGWLEQAKWRRKNREWLRKSQEVALRVLETLDERGMQQKELAEAMDVSPQQVSKIVKGKENLTLQTISKLEQVLGISLFKVPRHSYKINIKPKENAKVSVDNRSKRQFTVKEPLENVANDSWKESEQRESNLSLVA